MQDLIIFREFSVTTPCGDNVKTVVGLSKPIQKDAVTWSTTVRMGRLHPVDREFTGVDSWQTVQLAMNLIYLELKSAKDEGFQFRWSDGEPVDFRDLLPALGKSTDQLGLTIYVSCLVWQGVASIRRRSA